jgi:hypothetical protein
MNSSSPISGKLNRINFNPPDVEMILLTKSIEIHQKLHYLKQGTLPYNTFKGDILE